MFSYTHPLLTQGAGRIKTDPVNEQRIQTVLQRYEEWASKNSPANTLTYNVDRNQLTKSMILFPLAGTAVTHHHYDSWELFPPSPSFTPIPNILANASQCSQLTWGIRCTNATSSHTMWVDTSATSQPTRKTSRGWYKTTMRGMLLGGWKTTTCRSRASRFDKKWEISKINSTILPLLLLVRLHFLLLFMPSYFSVLYLESYRSDCSFLSGSTSGIGSACSSHAPRSCGFPVSSPCCISNSLPSDRKARHFSGPSPFSTCSPCWISGSSIHISSISYTLLT